MEKKILEKEEALQIAALQNDVQELKAALQAKQLKEEIIANILLEQDKKKLQKIAAELENSAPKTRVRDKEGAIAEQGNK